MVLSSQLCRGQTAPHPSVSRALHHDLDNKETHLYPHEMNQTRKPRRQ